MLKAIENLGLLNRSYAAKVGDSGRSQVLFVPTPRAEELLREEAADDEERWQADESAVLRWLGRGRDGPGAFLEARRKMDDDVPVLESCAIGLGVMMTQLRQAGGRTEEFVVSLVKRAPSAELAMAMLAAAALGAVAPSMAESGAEMAELAAHYLKQMALLTDREKE